MESNTTLLSGVYQIISIKHNDRCYIGSSFNINKRFSDHKRMLLNNNHHSIKLQNHYNKYGFTDLIFEILERCEVAKLLILEQAYMDDKKPYFNICPKARSPIGVKHSAESRRNMTLCKIGKKQSLETIMKRISKTTGLKRNNEQKKRCSEGQLKISDIKREWMKGNKNSSKITHDDHLFILSNIESMTQARLAGHLRLTQSTISKHLKTHRHG